ncbi:MAG: glycerophosphodiester phosphodiesterase family protein [Gemmatimonadales bacterium]
MKAPLVIAHRGAAAEAPENTIEAFDLSVLLGADALELDVQQAGDGTLVVIHDRTVDRTTEAVGPVAGFSGAELARLGVPALEEVADVDSATGLPELPEGFPEVVHAPLVGPAGPIVTAELVTAARRVGLAVQVWTIDDPGRMRQLCHWGVDGIITNDVRRAVKLLKEEDEEGDEAS